MFDTLGGPIFEPGHVGSYYPNPAHLLRNSWVSKIKFSILYFIWIICSYFNVTSSGLWIAMKARSKQFIDQGRTTLYERFWYICQYRCNVVLIWDKLLQHTSNDTLDSCLILKKSNWSLKQNVFRCYFFTPLTFNVCWLI